LARNLNCRQKHNQQHYCGDDRARCPGFRVRSAASAVREVGRHWLTDGFSVKGCAAPAEPGAVVLDVEKEVGGGAFLGVKFELGLDLGADRLPCFGMVRDESEAPVEERPERFKAAYGFE
jgi:hypothetical protein